jgi:hypothetical protein
MAIDMKRRRFFKTVAALPAGAALIPQQPAAAQAQGAARGSNIPAFQETPAELAGAPEPRFFNAAQFAALRRLSALFLPPLDGNPGAVECGAPEFLDFLIGASLPARQKLYRDGLDALNAGAMKKYKKDFASLDDAQADSLVRPMLAPNPWFYDPPKDPLVHFATEAHRDIRTATQNSREWANSGKQRFGGRGQYLNPIDPIYRS